MYSLLRLNLSLADDINKYMQRKKKRIPKCNAVTYLSVHKTKKETRRGKKNRLNFEAALFPSEQNTSP